MTTTADLLREAARKADVVRPLTVAYAVAELLDNAADDWERCDRAMAASTTKYDPDDLLAHEIALARAILRKDQP